MSRSGQHQDPRRPPPRLRRAYYDCRYGQLHLHHAIPSGGGFDELIPVICLHGAGETGQVFLPLLPALGDARSVYALDAPGAGASDPAPNTTATDAIVNAVCDFVDSMRIRSFDVVARGTAAAAALRLLELRGAWLRRVLLLGASGALRNGPKVKTLSEAEGQPGRLVELLAPAA